MLETMSFGESLLTSLTGLAVVFTVLIVLALATIAIAKVVGKLTGTQSTPAPAAPKAGAAEEELGDIVAALQGALSMESGIPVDKLVIKSIKSVPGASDKQQ